VVVGGIYSPNHQTNRWGWAAVDGRTGQSGAPPDTVRCTSHVTQPVGFDHLSSDSLGHRRVRWCTEQSLFTVRCAFWRCSDSARTVHLSADRCAWKPLLRWHTGQFGGTSDSPVNYSGVAWRKPEAEEFRVDLPCAPDTVRCARSGQPSIFFAPFFLNPNLFFLLVCVEPMAPIEHII
jgi:hypothetical protein